MTIVYFQDWSYKCKSSLKLLELLAETNIIFSIDLYCMNWPYFQQIQQVSQVPQVHVEQLCYQLLN